MLLIFPAAAWAERAGRVSVVAMIGALHPMMDHVDTDTFRARTDLAGGVLVGYGVNDRIGIEAGLISAEQRLKTDNGADNTMTTQEFIGQLRLNFLTGLFRPFATLGADYHIISLDPPLEDESDPGWTVGVGFEALLTDQLSFGVAGRYAGIFAENFSRAEMLTAMAFFAFTF